MDGWMDGRMDGWMGVRAVGERKAVNVPLVPGYTSTKAN